MVYDGICSLSGLIGIVFVDCLFVLGKNVGRWC